MIGYLKGKPIVQGDEVLLIVHDVGYRVHVSSKVLTKLLSQTEAELYIYTHVREEVLDLFGFLDTRDKKMFETLLSVSGVGPRTALHILDYGIEGIITAVQDANVSVFTAIPRIGKKLAQKIIIDLKPKLGSVRDLQLSSGSAQEQEITQALEALGFSGTDIYRALDGLDLSGELSTSEMLKKAMKNISR